MHVGAQRALGNDSTMVINLQVDPTVSFVEFYLSERSFFQKPEK